MTRLICEPHLNCSGCLYWQFIYRYAGRRGWGRIGVCLCRNSEHHGHTLDQTHQGCGHHETRRGDNGVVREKEVRTCLK
jgi:hypothetical protein